MCGEFVGVSARWAEEVTTTTTHSSYVHLDFSIHIPKAKRFLTRTPRNVNDTQYSNFGLKSNKPTTTTTTTTAVKTFQSVIKRFQCSTLANENNFIQIRYVVDLALITQYWNWVYVVCRLASEIRTY